VANVSANPQKSMKRNVNLLGKLDLRNLSNKDPNRRAQTRMPDTYVSDIYFKDGQWYVLLQDGWKAKGERNQLDWVRTTLAREEEDRQAAVDFANKYLIDLLQKRNLWAEKPEENGKTKAANGAPTDGKKTGLSLTEALPEIVLMAQTTQKRNTAQNTVAACNIMNALLPQECFLVRMKTLSIVDFNTHIRKAIAADPGLTVLTKTHYLEQIRAVVRILISKYDLPPRFEGCPETPKNMTGADSDERAFTSEQIKKMERKVRSSEKKLITESLKSPDQITETAEGLYYFGSAGSLQPVDVVFRKWEDFDQNLEFVTARRWKTTVRFRFKVSVRFRRWLFARKQRGGIWDGVYIFPELVFGKRACRNDDCNDVDLTQKQKEKILASATGRIAEFFDPFLIACEVKKSGISYKSFRHYNLPLLRSKHVPHEVSMDMAGQETLIAFLGYGDHGTDWEYDRTANLVESHYVNLGLNRDDGDFLTLGELAKHSDAKLNNAVDHLKENIRRVPAAMKEAWEGGLARVLKEIKTLITAKDDSEREDSQARLKLMLQSMGVNESQIQVILILLETLQTGQLRSSSPEGTAWLLDTIFNRDGNNGKLQ
jgi:hypothetical protein